MEKIIKRNYKFPKSPPTDSIDHKAIQEFKYQISPDWFLTQPAEDKGCDFDVEIKEEGELKAKHFRVQVKGTGSPSYDRDSKCIGYQLKVSTINYLISYAPGMLCVCVVNEDKKPIYWVWLQEFIKNLERTNPKWNDQESVIIHIPISQILNAESFKFIESYVLKYFDVLSVTSEIGKVVGAPLSLSNIPYQPLSVKVQKVLSKKIAPYLQDLGLADISNSDKSLKLIYLSRPNQKIFRAIKESSRYLESLDDKKAEEILNQIKKKVGPSPKSLKSKYFNNIGVLALHNNDMKKAIRYFKKANQTAPSEIKFVVNLLSAELYLAFSKRDIRKYLPKDWMNNLEKILKKDKNYQPALFLKSRYLSIIGSYNEALALIKSSLSWKKRKLEAYIVYAGILCNKNSYNEIINLLATIEDKPILKDPFYWAIYGDAYFALGLGENARSFELIGPGPANIEESSLRKAEIYYKHAWDLYIQNGFPLISEHTIQNYTACLILLGEYTKCNSICSIFLEYHPDCVSIIENYVAALNFQNSNILSLKAIDLAKHAFKIQPNSSSVFQNLILALFICDIYEELVNYVEEREKIGFSDKAEEGFSRSLLAISYDAIGKIELCNEQLALLANIPELFVDYSLAKAEIARRHSSSNDSILDILKSSPKNLEDARILAKIIQVLLPVSKINAENIIKIIIKLSAIRKLTSEEYSIYGKAYFELGLSDKAYNIFCRASARYPDDLRFLYLGAMAAYESGNEIAAFNCLEQYLNKSEKDYSILKKLALLARNIGKLDESIILLEKSLHKTTKPDQKAEIHCLLYEIKKVLARSPKELLRHSHEYGKLISKENNEDEVRYLLMFFLGSLNNKLERDAELESWISDFQKRLSDFLEHNPDNPSLRIFEIPADIPDEKKGEYIINQIACITLPRRLAIAPFELAIKSQPWPLAFRSQFLPGPNSIFDYWLHCTKSKEYSHSIHIWGSNNNIESEIAASKAKEICIDMNALLTLAEHNLFDYLSKNFRKIVIAKGTISSIEDDRLSIFGHNPIAERIYNWKQKNLGIIRIQEYIDEEIPEKKGRDRIIDLSSSQNRNLDKMIGDGVGESLLLAKRLGLTLYSDDTIIRDWAASMHNVNSFCTISFLARLKKESIIDIAQETKIYSKMIKDNYRIIPFSSDHLFSAIKLILEDRNEYQIPIPNNDELTANPIIGPFLRQYAEPSLNYNCLVEIAVDWWLRILSYFRGDRQRLLEECMKFISFCLCTQRTSSGVLLGIKRNENAHKAAQFWGFFLTKCTIHDNSLNLYAWLAIKENCRDLFQNNEKTQNDVLYNEIPYHIVNFIWGDKKMSETQKATYQCRITESLKYELDRYTLEVALARCQIHYKKKRNLI